MQIRCLCQFRILITVQQDTQNLLETILAKSFVRLYLLSRIAIPNSTPQNNYRIPIETQFNSCSREDMDGSWSSKLSLVLIIQHYSTQIKLAVQEEIGLGLVYIKNIPKWIQLVRCLRYIYAAQSLLPSFHTFQSFTSCHCTCIKFVRDRCPLRSILFSRDATILPTLWN